MIENSSITNFDANKIAVSTTLELCMLKNALVNIVLRHYDELERSDITTYEHRILETALLRDTHKLDIIQNALILRKLTDIETSCQNIFVELSLHTVNDID